MDGIRIYLSIHPLRVKATLASELRAESAGAGICITTFSDACRLIGFSLLYFVQFLFVFEKKKFNGNNYYYSMYIYMCVYLFILLLLYDNDNNNIQQ